MSDCSSLRECNSTEDCNSGIDSNHTCNCSSVSPTRSACDCNSISESDSTCDCSTNNMCSSTSTKYYTHKNKWIIGYRNTPHDPVPQVSTKLNMRDILDAWKVRWGINRMNYKINPGLYCVGSPDENSPVLVTANYKLTFDMLRKELSEINTWIMVLDTNGVNVWCAAGKGTFGTEELIHRIGATKLPTLVSHRNLILPQLGAPGIQAHTVTKNTSFKITYGPVRASDIKEFLSSGMNATPEMRTVKFNMYNRLVLVPNEITQAIKPSLIIFGILFILNLIGLGPFGIIDFYAYIGAFLSGCFLSPLLLPFIPGRAFAAKGWIIGVLWALLLNVINGFPAAPEYSWLKAAGYLFILPPISAFYAMNFTGSSTYTSLSGVLKEMKVAVPAIISSAILGAILLITYNIIN